MKKQIKEKLNAVKNGEADKAKFIRFLLNGCLAAAVHYGVYLLLLYLFVIAVEDQLTAPEQGLRTNIAYIIGYIVSFAVNFYTTCYFTFHTSPSWKRFTGFSGSHGVNLLLHSILFWCCMQLGIHRLIAPVIVMGIAMLVQFTILRFVFRKK